ncbi:hypothetical protein [Bradyrhizobium oligotrophicum]|uniref:hypothetical protein n=1 Tax=Bradyrhizobium oligotrophicum TaxID=44255 RepID=UPI003EBB68E0
MRATTPDGAGREHPQRDTSSVPRPKKTPVGREAEGALATNQTFFNPRGLGNGVIVLASLDCLAQRMVVAVAQDVDPVERVAAAMPASIRVRMPQKQPRHCCSVNIRCSVDIAAW